MVQWSEAGGGRAGHGHKISSLYFNNIGLMQCIQTLSVISSTDWEMNHWSNETSPAFWVWARFAGFIFFLPNTARPWYSVSCSVVNECSGFTRLNNEVSLISIVFAMRGDLGPKEKLFIYILLGPPGCAQVFPYLSPGPLDLLVVCKITNKPHASRNYTQDQLSVHTAAENDSCK